MCDLQVQESVETSLHTLELPRQHTTLVDEAAVRSRARSTPDERRGGASKCREHIAIKSGNALVPGAVGVRSELPAGAVWPTDCLADQPRCGDSVCQAIESVARCPGDYL